MPNVLKVGYLGPRGTFSELAVEKYLKGKAYTALPFRSIEAVFKSVGTGEADMGILPIENSCEGAVNQTVDLLANGYPHDVTNEIKITGEIILPIKHSLLVRPNVLKQNIECIISHPQALAQCRKYLGKNFPKVELIEVSSTAEAVKKVSQSTKAFAAIAMANIAEKNGLVVLQKNINDYPNNETRFIVISKEENSCTTNCKTSLLLNVLDQPGALYQVLKEFSLRNINLTKIESRPAKTKIGEYVFFIDLDGHYLDPEISEAINRINIITYPVKVLGSYPAATVGNSK
jgi:prephenate dehydratase